MSSVSQFKRVYYEGRKVIVRSLEEQDLDSLWSLIYEDPDAEWKHWDAPYFQLKHLERSDYVEKKLQSLQAGSWPPHACVIEADGNIIGQVSFYWECEETRWMEMGIVIYHPSYWNGGYGTEALTFWTDFMFQTLDVARVGLTTWSGNHRMVRVAEKLGMQMEGRMRKCRYYEGEYYDSIRMGILREEWEAYKQQQHSNPL